MKINKAAIEENMPLAVVFGGLAILILGADCYTGYHYLKNLEGPAKLAIAGIGLGTFIVIFFAYWSLKSTNAARMWVAFGCKVVLMGVMLLCMASLIVLYMHNKAEKIAKAEQAKAAKLAQDNEIKAEAEKAQIDTGKADAIADAIIRVKKETGSNAVANNFAKLATKEEKKPITIPSADAKPKATAAEEKEEDPGLGIYEWLLEFSQKHIYYVPTLAHFLTFVLMCFVLVATQEKVKPIDSIWSDEDWMRYQPNFSDSVEVRPTGPLADPQSGKALRR